MGDQAQGFDRKPVDRVLDEGRTFGNPACPARTAPSGSRPNSSGPSSTTAARPGTRSTWTLPGSRTDADSLLPPEVIAQEIVEDLEAALREFAAIAEALSARTPATESAPSAADQG